MATVETDGMIKPLGAHKRGNTKNDWLNSYHSFSFGSYRNPDYMNFGNLRVINEDFVAPGAGFDTHSHKDMEIITLVLEGALEHKDSLGNGSVIHAGDVQRMSAGTGIEHSEFNHSKTEPVHFYQIWLFPSAKDLEPGYEQKSFAPPPDDKLRLIASRDGAHNSVSVNQDVMLYHGRKTENIRKIMKYTLAPGRKAWVQLMRGKIIVNGYQRVQEGDGIALEDVPIIEIRTLEQGGEFLLFDMG